MKIERKTVSFNWKQYCGQAQKPNNLNTFSLNNQDKQNALTNHFKQKGKCGPTRTCIETAVSIQNYLFLGRRK